MMQHHPRAWWFLAVAMVITLAGLGRAGEPPPSELRLRLPLQAGWNTFSLPATPTPTGAAGLSEAGGTRWLWDNSTGHFVLATDFEPATGYWTHADRPADVLYDVVTEQSRGEPRAAHLLEAGWHLVGVRAVREAAALPVDAVWAHEGNRYRPVTTLLPGKAYWIHCDSPAWADLGSTSEDVEADGMPDFWEAVWGLDALRGDAALDRDGDGLDNASEMVQQTSPDDPDTDRDGRPDGEEVNLLETDPRSAGDPRPRLPVTGANLFPTRLARGPGGRLYVTDARANSVFVYNSKMRVIEQLSGLDRPLGIALDARGYLYVGNDGRDNVEIYSPAGVRVATLDQGQIRMPSDIAVDQSGRVYVVDSQAGVIRTYEYDSVWKSAGTIGTAGDGPGELRFPAAIALGYRAGARSSGELYVADQGHSVIRVYALDGTYLRSFGGRPLRESGGLGFREARMGFGGATWNWHGRFFRIQGLAVDSGGRLHASDVMLNNVQIIDPTNGDYIAAYGELGTAPGQLRLPLDVLVDAGGRAVVADAENGRLQHFNVP